MATPTLAAGSMGLSVAWGLLVGWTAVIGVALIAVPRFPRGRWDAIGAIVVTLALVAGVLVAGGLAS